MPGKYKAGGQCLSKDTLIMKVDGEIIEIKYAHNPCIIIAENFNIDKSEETPIITKWENKKQLFIPRGFAHGFIVLSDTAIFSYKCDNFYNKESEGGIIYNDKDLNIDWKLDESELIFSEKDLELPWFKEAHF